MKRNLRFPKLLRSLLILPLAALSLFIPMACNQGTESGTETGLQGIQGGLSREGSSPAVGAEVYAFRRAAASTQSDSAILLRVLQNPDTLTDSLRFKSTLTDGKGQYRFTDLAAGDYGILGFYSDPAVRGKWVGFNPTVKVTALSVTEAGTLNLRRLGGISAVVASDAAGHPPLENVMCHIPGLSFVAFSDAAGRCVLLNVPEGSYTMGFDHAGYISRKIGPVAVESGNITALPDTVRLARDPSGPPPAPKGFSASVDADNRIVSLSWDPAEVPDVAGYILYRRPIDSIGNVIESPLTNTLVRGNAFRDTLWKSLSDTSDITYVYRLEAMDAEGNHSPSAILNPVHVAASAFPIRLQFTRADYAAAEGDGSVVAMVRRLGPVDRAVTVKWILGDSTALKDSDYVALNGEIAFAAGDTVKPLHALLVNDDHVEAQEAFFARLQSPGNGAILAAPSRAALIVRDDDSLTRLVCPQTDYAVRESDSVFVRVRRDGDLNRAATVRFQTLGYPAPGATAKPGEDFLPDSGSLAFAKGVASLLVPVRIVDDTVEEKTKRILFRLSQPSRDVDISACPDVRIDVADNDSNYTPMPVDFTKAYTSHNGTAAGTTRFPGGLYDGDTTLPGLSEFKTSNPALLPKPLAEWNFQDCGKPVIPDRTGNGHDGTVGGTLECRTDSAGSPAAGTWGRFNNDDTVIVASVPDLDFRDALTITALVKPDSTNFRRTVIGKLYAPTAFALEIVDDQWSFNVVIDDGTLNGYSYTLTAPAQAGVWTNVAATYDGTIMRLFLNGELATEQTVTGLMKVTDRPITIGNHPSWSTFTGGIKDIKLFKQALNGYQIQEQMRLNPFPPRPLSVTFAFPEPLWTQGAAASLSGKLGTKQYAWTLSAANTQADLDGTTGSFAQLVSVPQAAAGALSRAAYKARAFKLFRFTVTGLAGTGFVQINELSLTGAERIKL